MPTECSAERFDFGIVEGRIVEAAFDAGLVTSDAGALLLGATDRAIDLVGRFADCFRDHRRQDLIEHAIGTLVGQRVFGMALGYEDLNDHDELRHDPLMAVLSGKLAARRENCAPVAGKSTLNRLELSREEPSRYHKIAYDAAAIEALPVTLFLEAHQRPPRQIILDLDATDDPLHGHQEGRFFHGYYDCYCYLPLYVFCGRHLLAARLRPSDIDASAGSLPRRERRPRKPAARRAASRTSNGRRLAVGARGAASSPRRSGRKARPIRASSSPRSSAARRARGSSMRISTVRAVTWRTGSRNASSTSTPTGPRPPPCVPISSDCGSPRWPMC